MMAEAYSLSGYQVVIVFLCGSIFGIMIVKLILFGYDVTPRRKRYRPRRWWQFWRKKI